MLCPEPLITILNRNQSYTTSGDKSKGEDWDFVLENINKTSKGWIPRGVPIEAMWVTTYINLDRYKK